MTRASDRSKGVAYTSQVAIAFRRDHRPRGSVPAVPRSSQHAHGGTAVTTCWECETTTRRPIGVMLDRPAARLGPFMLCPQCYRAYYLPLIAESSRGAAPGRALPRAKSDPGGDPLML